MWPGAWILSPQSFIQSIWDLHTIFKSSLIEFSSQDFFIRFIVFKKYPKNTKELNLKSLKMKLKLLVQIPVSRFDFSWLMKEKLLNFWGEVNITAIQFLGLSPSDPPDRCWRSFIPGSLMREAIPRNLSFLILQRSFQLWQTEWIAGDVRELPIRETLISFFPSWRSLAVWSLQPPRVRRSNSLR